MSTGRSERIGCVGRCQYTRGLGGTERAQRTHRAGSGRCKNTRALRAHGGGAAYTAVGLRSNRARGVRRAAAKWLCSLGWEVCVTLRCKLEALRTSSPPWHRQPVPTSIFPTRVTRPPLHSSLPDSFQEGRGDQREMGCARGRRESTEPGACGWGDVRGELKACAFIWVFLKPRGPLHLTRV